MAAPDWPGYVARPCVGLAKWEAVKALRLAANPAPDAPNLGAWLRGRIAWVPDPADHWQAPAETLRLGTGDCEDFAILHRAILLARGWPSSGLAVITGRDLVRRCDHAVLWASGQVWDNLSDAPLTPAALAGVFTPAFAFGDADTWAYGISAP